MSAIKAGEFRGMKRDTDIYPHIGDFVPLRRSDFLETHQARGNNNYRFTPTPGQYYTPLNPRGPF